MNTKQLQCCIRCDPILRKHILGVFSADGFPKHLESFPCGFIVNADNHLQPGTHWVAFYFPSRDTLEFFDSFGRLPLFYNRHFSEYSKRYTHNIVNRRKLQSYSSNVCGFYCLFFLLQRLQHVSMNKFVNMFSFNVYFNDTFVFDFISNIFSKCL